MRHYFLLFFLVVFLSKISDAQSVYKLSYAKEFTITGLCVATLTPSFFLKKNKPVLNETQLNQLNKADIWKVDRFACNNWNPKIAKASDVLMFGSMVLPALLLINKPARNEAGKISLLYFETLLLNAGITNLTKEIFKRKRPYTYNANAPLSKKMERDATSSFFSGHTSFAASSSFFLAKVYADTNPNSKWKPVVWTSAAIIPLTTGIFRVAAGKHFPTDILVGYLVGAATGIFVPHLHKINRSPQNIFRN